jgi:flagellar basal-body rod modification protein FlgD
MASAVSALTSSNSNATGSSSAGGSGSSSNASQQVFLQLLVSQLQNQDPLNPTDSTQFVTELAQFSQLEQTIAIRGDIESYAAAQAANTAAASGAPTGQTNSTSQTQP